jgi:hemerythrin-like domain-containing protein
MANLSTDPIAKLMQEHDEALLQLKHLNNAITSIGEEGYSALAFRQVSTALRFIAEEVNVHNRREEQALFPVLERRVDGPTKVLRSDHVRLRRGFVRLNAAVARVKKDRENRSSLRRLTGIGKDVVQLFVNHIHKENHILFPLVRQLLTKDELREIAKKLV